MRVFTDGACSGNGKVGAKAGFAVWFPEHKEWSCSKRIPDNESQTNQRAELSAIHEVAVILDKQGCYDEDIVIYTDSDYSIKCLTLWLTSWVARGWKTSEGKPVLHRDLIEGTSSLLSKCKSYRFHHVRAHTGGADDLSVNNDIVDRMARSSISDVPIPEPPKQVEDEIYEGCPLRLMGSPISEAQVLDWVRTNFGKMNSDIVNKHLLKAFAECCKEKDINITKQKIQKQTVLRTERGHLQITHSE